MNKWKSTIAVLLGAGCLWAAPTELQSCPGGLPIGMGRELRRSATGYDEVEGGDVFPAGGAKQLRGHRCEGWV